MLNKTIKNISILAVLLVITASSFSQMKQKVADRLYDELAFFKAVELYEDLASGKKATPYQVRRTAECYRLIGDSKSAEKWYAKLVSMSGVTGEDYYNYAQMLKSNENYKLANVQMEKFYEVESGNSIAKAHHESQDYVDELKVHADRFEITPVASVNTEDSEFGPSIYEENGEKFMVFASNRRNMNALNKNSQWDGTHFMDIYQVKIDDQNNAENKIEIFNKEVRSKYHEGPVAFTSFNGKEEMYLTRTNTDSKDKRLSKKRHNNLQIYYATRDKGGEWSELQAFHYNSPEYSVGHATFSKDGKIMYFVSDMPKFREGNANANKGETDIWMCERKTDGTWDFPENVKSVNTEGREMFPFVGATGILYFASDGHVGLGGLDLYRAEPNDDKTFKKPLNMGYPLNTNYDDLAFIVNDDETDGFFASNRESDQAVGSDDIYQVKILYPFGPKLFTVRGSVIDDKTGDKLADAVVKIVNVETGEIIKEVMADANGDYEITGVPEGKYKIVAEKEQFSLVSPFEFNTDDIKGREIVDANVRLKKGDCGLIGRVVDAETDKPVTSVKVTITNNTTGERFEYLTGGDGGFKDALTGIPCPGGLIDYTINFEKSGYFPKEVEFKYRITKEGIVDLNEFIKKLDLQAKTGTVNKFCKIGDILFDFNKDDIRPDAAAELDKLVACMKQYPDMRIEIGSHTDCRGKPDYNRRLSDKRAKSSMRYVISQGIDKNRIFGKGYGEDRLIEECRSCYSCSEEQHQVNRRTEFRIVSGGDDVENNSSNSFDN